MQTQDPNQPSLDVNLDALSAPAGGYDPDIHGGVPGGDDLNNLPNLDPQPDPEPTPSPEPTPDPDPNSNTDPNPQPDPQPEPNPNPDPQPAGEYWMKPFEKLKERFGDEYQIPEGVTEENYLEVLQQQMQPELHPEVAKIQEALDKGVDFNTYMNELQRQSNLGSMGDRELLAHQYKQTYKDWDDKKVNEVLDKLDSAGMLELEAGRLRNTINEQNQKLATELADKHQRENAANIEKMNQDRSNQINQAYQTFESLENVYGLEFSQAEKQEFKPFFEKLVTPDDTGVAPMFQMLQSNETLVKLAAMMWKGDDKVRSALTNAKESGKSAIVNKLDKTPQSPPKSGSPTDPTKVDMDALAAPEKLHFG